MFIGAKMFEVNDKLKKAVLENMPASYSNLAKALYIYQELCQRLEYSMDYFLNESEVRDYYTDVNNISLIDGIERKDVVCFTFNVIYLKILMDEGICNENALEENDIISRSGRIRAMHEELTLNIDGFGLCADSTLGVLDNNDLVYAKYGPSFTGWSTLVYNDPAAGDALTDAIGIVAERSRNLISLENDYLTAKTREKSLLDLSFEDRVDIFLKSVENIPAYSMQSFNYILQLKHKLFSEEELNSGIRQKANILFAKNKDSGIYECFLLINPEGYTDDKGYENFDSLQVYTISTNTGLSERLDMDRDELVKLLDEQYLTFDSKKVDRPRLITEGKLRIKPIFEEGVEPVYDDQQRLVTKPIAYARYVLEEETSLPCDKDGNLLR